MKRKTFNEKIEWLNGPPSHEWYSAVNSVMENGHMDQFYAIMAIIASAYPNLRNIESIAKKCQMFRTQHGLRVENPVTGMVYIYQLYKGGPVFFGPNAERYPTNGPAHWPNATYYPAIKAPPPLSTDVLSVIMSHLRVQDACALMRVSRHYYQAVSACSGFWGRLYRSPNIKNYATFKRAFVPENGRRVGSLLVHIGVEGRELMVRLMFLPHLRMIFPDSLGDVGTSNTPLRLTMRVKKGKWKIDLTDDTLRLWGSTSSNAVHSHLEPPNLTIRDPRRGYIRLLRLMTASIRPNSRGALFDYLLDTVRNDWGNPSATIDKIEFAHSDPRDYYVSFNDVHHIQHDHEHVSENVYAIVNTRSLCIAWFCFGICPHNALQPQNIPLELAFHL